MAKRTRVVRSLSDRLAAAEAQAKRLKALAAVGEDDNLRGLIQATAILERTKTLGKKEADSALEIARQAARKAVTALGF
jgi:hypothetical protein